MNGYPRTCCYAACDGGGKPLLKHSVPGDTKSPVVPDLDLLTKLARYPVITLDATPWVSPYQPPRTDALMVLRKLNPRIQIGLYHVLGWFWTPSLPVGFVSQHRTFADAFHDVCREAGAFFPNGNVDVAKAEGGLTKLFCDAVSLGLFDFVFFDFMSAVTQPSLGAIERLTHAVKRAGGPGFKVIGNGWQDTFNLDGNMKEGFDRDMPNVSFEHIRQWRAGRPHRTDDWLQAGTAFSSLDTPEAQRAARFAHGTACLFDMQCSFGPDRDLKVTPYYGTWWLPEYDGGGLGAGWLGEPREAAVQLGTQLWRRYFSGGAIIVNPSTTASTISGIPKGLCRFDGTELGSVTVPARDCVMLRRAQ